MGNRLEVAPEKAKVSSTPKSFPGAHLFKTGEIFLLLTTFVFADRGRCGVPREGSQGAGQKDERGQPQVKQGQDKKWGGNAGK